MTEVFILGITITIVVFGVWKYMMDKGFDLVYARSMIVMIMVFIQNLDVLNCRSEKKSIFKTPFFNNPFALFAILSAILLQLVFAEIPITAQFLNVTPISLNGIMYMFLLSLIVIVVYEIYKLIYAKKHKKS